MIILFGRGEVRKNEVDSNISYMLYSQRIMKPTKEERIMRKRKYGKIPATSGKVRKSLEKSQAPSIVKGKPDQQDVTLYPGYSSSRAHHGGVPRTLWFDGWY